MKLTRQERAALRAAFQKMSLADKAEYIYSYYKLPILLGLIALFLLCSTVYQQLTKKEAVLYLACINVSVGDDLGAELNGDSSPQAELILKRLRCLSITDSICPMIPPRRTTNMGMPPN